MRPDVDGLVVALAKSLGNFPCSLKVNSVTGDYELVVLRPCRHLMQMSIASRSPDRVIGLLLLEQFRISDVRFIIVGRAVMTTGLHGDERGSVPRLFGASQTA